jgi:NAD(P)-dependent dehydrogenase (short-subunit alcohol dehydrogenase family)
MNNIRNLEETSVLVTGGASGLGAATAQRLARLGALVTIMDLPRSEGQKTAKDLGATVVYAAADICEESSLDAALDIAVDRGPLRGIVHCAGRGGDRTRILDRNGDPAPLKAFRDMLEINLIGTYNVLRLGAARIAATEPVEGERGSIVLTSSIAAFDGQIGQTSYTASKAAIHGITLVAARDLASRMIRVNTIAPGVFDTPMLARLREDIRIDLAAAVPHPKRFGSPDDYAHLAVSLLQNGYVNGETIRLDGGIRMPPR